MDKTMDETQIRLLSIILSSHPNKYTLIIMGRLEDKALDYASKKHRGQQDDRGRPYFFAHVIQVHNILQDVTDDEETLCAGLLHDVIEDTDTTYEELVHEFTKEIADLVMEVTHEGDNYKNVYFPRLKSRKAVMIQFADRLSNMSRMNQWPGSVQQDFLDRSTFWRKEPLEEI
jgi:GTP pyrophosphokinase